MTPGGTAPGRIPDWGWTVVVGIATVLTFGLMSTLADPGLFGGFRLAVTAMVTGLVGGVLARRAADLVGIVAGTVLAFEALAAVEVAQHGAPLETLRFMFGTALIPGSFAAVIGLIVVGVRRGLRGAGVRSGLGQVAGIVVAGAGLAWLYVLGASTPSRADVYRVTGERDIVITVTGGYSTWCRVTSVAESAADVTVGTACVSLILGPTLAVGIPTDLAIQLDQALGDRIVRNPDGSVVRRNPPPDHAISQDRAMEIARGILATDHPGIATENTKVMDLSLEKDPAGRAAWKVNIIVVDGPFASASPTSIWLWVDAESGGVTVISRT